MVTQEALDKHRNILRVLALFTFVIAPIASWIALSLSSDTMVYASISRMIWYSGNTWAIIIAMALIFVPEIVAFFKAVKLSGISWNKASFLRIALLVSLVVLYCGAMRMKPGNGGENDTVAILHGIMSFGGILCIFITMLIYAVMNHKEDPDGSNVLLMLITFSIIMVLFNAENVYDPNSYVIVSAVTEIYALLFTTIVGYLSYFFAYRHARLKLELEND